MNPTENQLEEIAQEVWEHSEARNNHKYDTPVISWEDLSYDSKRAQVGAVQVVLRAAKRMRLA